MSSRKPILIFDFDDLLVNSSRIHEEAFEAALEVAGVSEPIPPKLYAKYYGLRIADISKNLKRHFKFKMPIEEYLEVRNLRFMELVRQGLELMPGAEKFARLVREMGIRRALASSGTCEYLSLGLEKTGFSDFFEVVTSGDEVANGKPAPDIFLKTAEKLCVLPSECVVIEDSESGIKAARNAKMKCIGVKNPFSPVPQDMSKAGAIVDSLGDIDDGLLLSL